MKGFSTRLLAAGLCLAAWGRAYAVPPEHSPFEPDERPAGVALAVLARSGDEQPGAADFHTGIGEVLQLRSEGRDLRLALLDGQGNAAWSEPVWCGEGLAEFAEAYTTDLNGDGVPDYVLSVPIGGIGLPAEIRSVAVVLSAGTGYRVHGFDQFYVEPADFIACGDRTVLVHTSLFPSQQLSSGRTDSFWVYNLIGFSRTGELEFRNELLDGFPRTIWYTFKPNHAEDRSRLTTAEKAELLRQSWGLIRTPEGAGRRALDAFRPRWANRWEGVYSDLVVRSYGNDTSGLDGTLEALYQGRRVWMQDGDVLFWIVFNEVEGGGSLQPGVDITGDGRPNAVAGEWGGGVHGGPEIYLYEAGPRFRLLQKLRPGEFKNLDDDPALEYQQRDSIFTYWRSCYAASPQPLVPLKFRDGRYAVEPALMRRPPATRAELDGWVEEARQALMEGFQSPMWDPHSLPYALLGRMVDLTYSGNLTQALELLELAWSDEIPGKEEFRADFEENLRSSRFWPTLRELNGLPDPHGEAG